MKLIKSIFLAITLLSVSNLTLADKFIIDTEGGHAAINTKFRHLGVSWLVGEFKTLEGTFTFDPDNVEASSVVVDIDTTSLDSNHERRDAKLSEAEYLNVAEFPTAKFVSTSVVDKGEGNMTVNGDFTFRGMTKPLAMEVKPVGIGETRFNDFRAGFEGTAVIDTQEYGMETFGPDHKVYLDLYVEGIRKE